MIKFGNVHTFGWEAAISGMRNSYASWEKADSGWSGKDFKGEDIFVIGPEDLKLACRLAAKGGSHAKFRRMIHVQMDILAPRYWWHEFDTYKVATVRNSTSTMHSILNKKFTIDDFSHEHLGMTAMNSMKATINVLNGYRDNCLLEKDKKEKGKLWWNIIQLLPSSYNQLSTIDINYEVLAHMVDDRKNHKLDEWLFFSKMVREECPYSKGLIFREEDYGAEPVSKTCDENG